MSCADHDFATMVDCPSFEKYQCDATDYFTCLTENTTCDGATGTVDTTGWDTCAEDLPCE